MYNNLVSALEARNLGKRYRRGWDVWDWPF